MRHRFWLRRAYNSKRICLSQQEFIWHSFYRLMTLFWLIVFDLYFLYQINNDKKRNFNG